MAFSASNIINRWHFLLLMSSRDGIFFSPHNGLGSQALGGGGGDGRHVAHRSNKNNDDNDKNKPSNRDARAAGKRTRLETSGCSGFEANLMSFKTRQIGSSRKNIELLIQLQ